MASPTKAEVGNLLSMSCGHNGKPLDIEATILAIHLDLAGFITTRNDGATSTFGTSPSFAPRFSVAEPKQEAVLDVKDEARQIEAI